MARIAGVDLPRNKRIEISLTYIFGVGRKTALDICAKTGIDPGSKTELLSEAETIKIREVLERENGHSLIERHVGVGVVVDRPPAIAGARSEPAGQEQRGGREQQHQS